MNILVMEWPAFGQETIKTVFRELGHKVCVMEFPHKEPAAKNGEELCKRIVEKVLKEGIEIVFSFNYFPVIATAVQACRIKYVSGGPSVFYDSFLSRKLYLSF